MQYVAGTGNESFLLGLEISSDLLSSELNCRIKGRGQGHLVDFAKQGPAPFLRLCGASILIINAGPPCVTRSDCARVWQAASPIRSSSGFSADRLNYRRLSGSTVREADRCSRLPYRRRRWRPQSLPVIPRRVRARWSFRLSPPDARRLRPSCVRHRS